MKGLIIAAALVVTLHTTACGGGSPPPPPPATATPSERTIRQECDASAQQDVLTMYGQPTLTPLETATDPEGDRFNEFYKDVILVALMYGRDETADIGSDFEETYRALFPQSAYRTDPRIEYWMKMFDQCLEAHGIAPYREPKMDATTRCVTESVAEAWKQYGDGALDYADELAFTFHELAEKGTELSIGEAWSIAEDYRQQTGRSPFKNPAAFELATSRNCEPWQGEGTGPPIRGP